MSESKKIYRIFISSCQRLLKKERSMLSDIILTNGHMPINMEHDFIGDSTTLSNDIDKAKIDYCDCVILLLSFLYGKEIGNKIGDVSKCPLRNGSDSNSNENCAACHNNKCHLSYTEFEYEYAKKIGKPVIVIVNENYADESFFEKYISKFDDTCKRKLMSDFHKEYDKNKIFVNNVALFHKYSYLDERSFENQAILAVRAAINTVSEYEKTKKGQYGLIPYAYLYDSLETIEKIKRQLQDLQQSGVEKIFKNQQEAIESLENSDYNLYIGKDGKIKTNKILAIRGDSFVTMGHDWCKFLLDDKYKNDKEVPIEFILGNENNEELIKGRYQAFNKKQDTYEDYLKFMKKYQKEMQNVQQKILEYKQEHICELFKHNESRLPFRMIFIGCYLYLSVFTSDIPAAGSPVIKISEHSMLYRVCEEYYEWIKTSSIHCVTSDASKEAY